MIAVTGSNGLLGSYIIRELIVKKEPFIALKRKDSDCSLLHDVADQISWREADILDTVSLEEALTDIDTVIHAAALVSFNPSDKHRLFKVNTEGTRNVVNACLVNKVSRLIHISSVAALGRPKEVTVIDENQKWIDSPFNTIYGESKYLAELEVMRGFEEGLNVVIVNPSVILGPGDWNRSSAQLFKYVWKERKFYIDGQMNYVDIRDVSLIISELVHRKEIQGTRLIVNAGTVDFKILFTQIARRFHKKPPSIKVNTTLLPILASMERFRAWLLNTTPLITRETAATGKTLVFFDNKKVKNLLLFTFKSFDNTVDWCCKEFVELLNSKK